jgi:hypothetical protein
VRSGASSAASVRLSTDTDPGGREPTASLRDAIDAARILGSGAADGLRGAGAAAADMPPDKTGLSAEPSLAGSPEGPDRLHRDASANALGAMPADAVPGALPGTSALDTYAAAVGLPAGPPATSGEAAAPIDAAAQASPAAAGAVSSVAASTTAASSSPADGAATPAAAASEPVAGAMPVDARPAGAERPFHGSPSHVDPGRREDVASSAGPQAVTGDARSGEQRLLTVLSTLDLSDFPSNPQRLRLLPDDAIARLRRGDCLELLGRDGLPQEVKVAWINSRRTVVLLVRRPDRRALSLRASELHQRFAQHKAALIV